MKANSKVIKYTGSDGHVEIAIQCTLEACYNWGGLGICDLCNNESQKYMYLCPELGHKGLCDDCFKEHMQRVKWYPEDREYVLQSLTDFLVHYGLILDKEDRTKINEFIEEVK